MTGAITVGAELAPGAEWDAFVRRSEGWTHFHLSGWQRVIRGVFGHDCPYLTARGVDGELAAVLPLVRVRSPIFGHFLVSMPFVNYGGPLGTAEGVRAVATAASELATRSGAGLLELRSRRELPITLQASHRKLTVLMDLAPNEPEAVWRALPAKVRSQVRRPQKEGLTVRFGAEQVRPFFSVFARHMRDLGTPTQSLRFFHAIAREFGDDAWFACVYAGDRPVACGCAFRWANELEMTWASSLREYSRLSPNMLLYWAFMERASREGLATFNFGRCTPGSNTHRFKQQWGTRDETLWWYQQSRGEKASTPSPDDSAYAWGPRIWRRLPVPVATALGPRIVRYIP